MAGAVLKGKLISFLMKVMARRFLSEVCVGAMKIGPVSGGFETGPMFWFLRFPLPPRRGPSFAPRAFHRHQGLIRPSHLFGDMTESVTEPTVFKRRSSKCRVAKSPQQTVPFAYGGSK